MTITENRHLITAEYSATVTYKNYPQNPTVIIAK